MACEQLLGDLVASIVTDTKGYPIARLAYKASTLTTTCRNVCHIEWAEQLTLLPTNDASTCAPFLHFFTLFMLK